MSPENLSNTGNSKIEVIRIPKITEEQLTTAEATIDGDDLLRNDSLAAEMIEKGFKLSDGSYADPASWVSARRAILEAGPTTLDEDLIDAAKATPSEPYERQLSDKDGLPEKQKRAA